MASPAPRCPHCRRALPTAAEDLDRLDRCPDCTKPLRVAVFPGFRRGPVAGRAAAAITGEGEAACYFHATKKAVVPCDECGRFLCALCDITLDDRHLCPTCLQTAHAKGTVETLEKSRVRWDIMAWYINLACFTCIGAPVAAVANIVLLILRWRSPASRVARSRLRLVSAVVFSLVACGVTAFMILGSS